MSNYEINIRELQNKIDNQHKIYKVVLYSTIVLVLIILLYIGTQLFNFI